MAYFTEDFISFFEELSNNNNKEWFHANKKRYEKHIKKPFAVFTQTLINEIGKHEKLEVLAKDCIMRINRDIRFAKDKTPYNTHVTAIISNEGKKNTIAPSIGIRLSAEKIHIMGGCYTPDKTQVANIRNTIISNPKILEDLIAAPAFKNLFGYIQGEQMKRIPKELKDSVIANPILLHKQFYYMAELSKNHITSPALLENVMAHYYAMRPMTEYFKAAVGNGKVSPLD